MRTLIAAAQPLPQRLAVAGVAVAIGIVLIVSGLRNLRTGQAEESGARRLVNRAAGRSNTYTGSTARTVGIMRVCLGVTAIAFGAVFAVVGPFLS